MLLASYSVAHVNMLEERVVCVTGDNGIEAMALLAKHFEENARLPLVFGTPKARRSLAEHVETRPRGRLVLPVAGRNP